MSGSRSAVTGFRSRPVFRTGRQQLVGAMRLRVVGAQRRAHLARDGRQERLHVVRRAQVGHDRLVRADGRLAQAQPVDLLLARRSGPPAAVRARLALLLAQVGHQPLGDGIGVEGLGGGAIGRRRPAPGGAPGRTRRPPRGARC